MAGVAKWLTHLAVNQGFRGFDPHFSPHINKRKMLRHLFIRACGGIGRLGGLKIHWCKSRVGSSPTTPTKNYETTPVSWTEICYNEMGVLLYEIFDEREIKDS